MKDPKVSIPLLIVLVFVAIVVIKNWNEWFPSKPEKPVDGTPCTTNTTTGVIIPIPGTFKNGICVPNTGGGVNPAGGSRILINDISKSDNIVNNNNRMQIQDTIFIPRAGTACIQYTEINPYEYNGCRYRFEKVVTSHNRAYCQLKLISCP